MNSALENIQRLETVSQQNVQVILNSVFVLFLKTSDDIFTSSKQGVNPSTLLYLDIFLANFSNIKKKCTKNVLKNVR